MKTKELLYTPKIYKLTTTKRGNSVNKRNNKTSQGLTHTITDQSKKFIKKSVMDDDNKLDEIIKNKGKKRSTEHKNEVNKLSVRGTLDSLAGGQLTFLKKRVIVSHPTDTGYFKEVFILNDMGKRWYKMKTRHSNYTV